MGLNFAYMFVQLIGIVLLVIGVYRYASLWVSERAASFAAIGSIFLGRWPCWSISRASCQRLLPRRLPSTLYLISMDGCVTHDSRRC